MTGRKPKNRTKEVETQEALRNICERAGFVTEVEALQRIVAFYDTVLETTQDGGKIIHTHPVTGEKTRLVP